ncbi:ABC transporter permease [Mesorhizobium sp. M1A.F.Ca.IN.020.06.1.1]|uniref:ABC transporter permease n=1 Tax=unclassified Mesorhizobium TaxID=325217 RepID=UPI000FCB28BA|nr:MULTISPECIES: ABC transporter permease [unclassified Mesorhizobium]RUV87036.1 ABC transporter permease [Mesorhizobium sp. M1A.F.Ca.IN.020.32.1.1]RUW14337.1 ABC transporter permease [Mesorhizobium sp. M1A.F.Ca.IN.022.05.2.1]RUW37674.1 ABC transporter permease [Mesorhizobium sp. M1A.F.Ca.IN.020.06.1.1]RWB52725.1 MAG: ABC transporter permease [Mesorhizobium sp.]RWF82787.1 MAG: ABC transporter permease [Mesorhizobium sp.]
MTELPIELRRRSRLRATKAFLRQFLDHKGARLGVLALTIFLVLAAVPGPLVGPLHTAITATGDFLTPPSSEHLLGTDEVGRDVLNLVIHGARISLTIALIATVISLIVGTTVGMMAGFYRGRVDVWLMRLTDFFFVLPSFVLALVITPVVLEVIGRGGDILGFRPSLFVIVLVIGLTSWGYVARIVRSQTLSLRERTFVDRARVVGSNDLFIMGRHILPNLVPQIAANGALVVANAIYVETALSFLGLGDPLQPSWGTMLFLAQHAGAASAGGWWYLGAPGACVLIVSLSFVLIGNALDDTANPRRRVIP